MMRLFLASTVAIAALLGACMVIILVLTRPEPIRPSPEPAAPLPPPSAVAIAADAPPAAASPVRTGASGNAAGASPAAWTPPHAQAPATPTTDRVTRKAIGKALRAAALQARLARCTAQAAFGGVASDATAAPRARPASLLLDIEAHAGELRIVDVQVRDFGGASEAMVSCARSVLRGQTIPARTRRQPTDERMQMPFLLNPRREAVASTP